MTQRDQNQWVLDHYTELNNWILPQDRGGKGKLLCHYEFPNQATHATAQAMLSDADDNLKHFISQKSQAEIRGEKKTRAGMRDDLRRQLTILKHLERTILPAPPDRKIQTESGQELDVFRISAGPAK